MDALTPDQRRQLKQALLAAFPSVPALEQMVRFQLDESLAEIAGGSNLDEIVFRLMEWAEAQGRLPDLTEGARRHNPRNPQLRAFADSVGLYAIPPAPGGGSSVSISLEPPTVWPDHPPPPVEGNPFLRDSSRLSGRTGELQRIVEHLLVGNHCSVVGPMGSGKTLLLRAVREHLVPQLGWQPWDCLHIRTGQFTRLRDLQTARVRDLGGREDETLATLLRRTPPRLLVLDDVGVLRIPADGEKIRFWLRGHADEGATFLVTSNDHLRVLFGTDPQHTSPFHTIFGPPVELDPLPPAVCRQIVTARLQNTGFPVARFEDLLLVPMQPRALLHACAQRYNELLRRH